MEEVRAVLARAREYLARGYIDRWDCQHPSTKGKSGCRWCVDGAIYQAGADLVSSYHAEGKAISMVHRHADRDFLKTMPRPIRDDVLKLFDKAIETLDAEN